MPPEQPDDALTAVTRRQPPVHTATNKTLAVLVGLVGAVVPAVTGYFAYRQAKLEAAADTKAVRGEASVGYRTLADPVELLTAFSKSHEARIETLEAEIRECALRQSVSEPPSAQPPTPPLRPLPRTLDEAAALAK